MLLQCFLYTIGGRQTRVTIGTVAHVWYIVRCLLVGDAWPASVHTEWCYGQRGRQAAFNRKKRIASGPCL